MTTATTKIVIVAGQEFSVPGDVTEKALRDHLAATFPDVANATVQKGSRTVDGVVYETIEFVKRAGTKGAELPAQLEERDINLPELLAEIPPLWDGVLAPAALDLVRRFLGGQMTIGEALDLRLADMIQSVPDTGYRTSGRVLCNQIDRLAATPSDSAFGW